MEEKPQHKLKSISIKEEKYYFNPFIFQIMIIFLILVIVVSGLAYGFSAEKSFYIVCDKKLNSTCENPLYNNFNYCGKNIPSNDYICKTEFLPSGFVYGSPPPMIYNLFGTLTILSFFLALIINHYLYNWRNDVE
jgi:hypothetical protein